ncbi:MAG: acetylxylan esterase [Vicinamibacteria bacterium]
MVPRRGPAVLVVAGVLLAQALPAGAGSLPPRDERAAVRTLDTPWRFDAPRDAAAWQARAKLLRQQVLVAAGLWPLPERRPLRAQVFGRTTHGDYSVEKVFFESYPGFYVTGNLYRPLGRTGPFPGVLSPHGHWSYGRLENSATGSVIGRAISLARQGYVVFSHDMVGYDDSRQVDHRLLDPALAQWGIGSLGLHLWNSVRGLDFLESLPDVDRARLACTGASGGGTQTFLLAAIDERVRVSAPVNMISHTMQGGDVCENAPILRLDASNMELGALTAPRPMIMVAATGDWTKDTPRVEYPAVKAVYSLLGATDALESVQFDAPHNYNRKSREAVYAFFARRILGATDTASYAEREFDTGPLKDLLVFFDRGLPPEAKTQAQITDALVADAKAQVAALLPRDAAGLARFRETLGVSLERVLAAEAPAAADVLDAPANGTSAPAGARDLVIGRRDRGDRVPLRVWGRPGAKAAVLVVHPEGAAGVSASLVDALRRRGRLVASVDAFNSGAAAAPRDASDRFFTTYNRTDDALRAQDVLTAVAWLKKQPGVRSVCLAGLGRAGLWSLLAAGLAPGVDAVAADVDRFPTADDDAYLGRVFVPLFRKAGGFDAAIVASLGAGSRVFLHDTAGAFDTARAEAAAQATGAARRLKVVGEAASDAEVVAWLTAGK